MANKRFRVAVCVLLGLFAGFFLGFTIAPDPTGATAPALSVVLGAVVAWGLYRTGFLREAGETPG